MQKNVILRIKIQKKKKSGCFTSSVKLSSFDGREGYVGKTVAGSIYRLRGQPSKSRLLGRGEDVVDVGLGEAFLFHSFCYGFEVGAGGFLFPEELYGESFNGVHKAPAAFFRRNVYAAEGGAFSVEVKIVYAGNEERGDCDEVRVAVFKLVAIDRGQGEGLDFAVHCRALRDFVGVVDFPSEELEHDGFVFQAVKEASKDFYIALLIVDLVFRHFEHVAKPIVVFPDEAVIKLLEVSVSGIERYGFNLGLLDDVKYGHSGKTFFQNDFLGGFFDAVFNVGLGATWSFGFVFFHSLRMRICSIS